MSMIEGQVSKKRRSAPSNRMKRSRVNSRQNTAPLLAVLLTDVLDSWVAFTDEGTTRWHDQQHRGT